MGIIDKLSSSQAASALRRYANAKKSVIATKMELDYIIRETVPPLTLFDFARDDDVEDFENKQWREGDDGDIGGLSDGKAEIVRCEKGDIKAFLRWSGQLNNTVPEGTRAVRSGYCAIQSPTFPYGGINLDEWDAIHLKCRLGQQRSYMFNLKADTFFPDDMYHGFFPARNPRVHPLKETPIVSTGGWTDVILPFNTFIVSSRGRMKTVPLELDTVKLEHVGFTMADGVDGKFQLDVASIKAVSLGEDYYEHNQSYN